MWAAAGHQATLVQTLDCSGEVERGVLPHDDIVDPDNTAPVGGAVADNGLDKDLVGVRVLLEEYPNASQTCSSLGFIGVRWPVK